VPCRVTRSKDPLAWLGYAPGKRAIGCCSISARNGAISRMVSPEGIDPYSARKAVVGSTRAARQAGTLTAAIATMPINPATVITVVASIGATP
jgi:hypothetical protein